MHGQAACECFARSQVADLPERVYEIQAMNPDENVKTTVVQMAAA